MTTIAIIIGGIPTIKRSIEKKNKQTIILWGKMGKATKMKRNYVHFFTITLPFSLPLRKGGIELKEIGQ